MFVGGVLIKQFDGFRRLCRRAAVDFNHELTIPDEDMLLANRILAGLGGPPAPSQVRGRFNGDGLATLLLFLLTQERECRAGLLVQAEPTMGRLKSLVHLLSHAVYPTIAGPAPLQFQDVVKELGPSGAKLKPLFRYDDDGEPIAMELNGGSGTLRVGAEGGPYTLVVTSAEGAGPAPLEAPGGAMHPAVLILT